MQTITRIVLAMATLACSPFAQSSPSIESGNAGWICPPCGCPSDGKRFDDPGQCPDCNMALTRATHSARQTTPVDRIPVPATPRKTVAVLVFPGVELIDFAGPYEVFGQAGCRVFTVAETKAKLTTTMGLVIEPSHSIDDCPDPDVVVLPGGGIGSASGSARVREWIKAQTERAGQVLSVCNGAFLLARVGALDGLSATTFYRLIPSLRTEAPNATVVSDRRFVDNGKIVTSAGLSSGIDGAMHVVEKLFGRVAAQRVALNLEYDWKPDGDYARASFVDQQLIERGILSPQHYPLLDAPGTEWLLRDTRGNSEEWSIAWAIATERTAAQVLEALDHKLETDGGWSRVADTANGESRWHFDGRDDRRYVATVAVRPNREPTVRAQLTASLEIRGANAR